MRFDKSKPFGEICGTCAARYEQDGRFFNAEGEEVTLDGELVTEDAPKRPGRPPKMAVDYNTKQEVIRDTTNPELDAQIAAQGV